MLPLLDAFFEEIQMRELLEAHCPVLHAIWSGLTPAQGMMVWFCYMVDQLDHRLSPVATWTQSHRRRLEALVGSAVRPEDLCDDKLGRLLEVFAQNEHWQAFETALNQQFIRLYDPDESIIQLDPTIGQSFRKTTEEGLFQRGDERLKNGLPMHRGGTDADDHSSQYDDDSAKTHRVHGHRHRTVLPKI